MRQRHVSHNISFSGCQSISPVVVTFNAPCTISFQPKDTIEIGPRKPKGIVKYSRHSCQRPIIRTTLATDATQGLIWPNKLVLKTVQLICFSFVQRRIQCWLIVFAFLGVGQCWLTVSHHWFSLANNPYVSEVNAAQLMFGYVNFICWCRMFNRYFSSHIKRKRYSYVYNPKPFPH